MPTAHHSHIFVCINISHQSTIQPPFSVVIYYTRKVQKEPESIGGGMIIDKEKKFLKRIKIL